MRKTGLVFQIVTSWVLLNPQMAAAQPGDFVAQDVEVCSAQFNVLDPEFDSRSQLMTFMNSQAQMRVTSMLPDGSVGPSGCSGALIDQAAWGWPGSNGYQGPEWARSQNGLEIFYTRFLSDGKTPALARAWANGGGWQWEYLNNGARRATIVTSTDDSDPQARIAYIYRSPTGRQIPMWRESTEPQTEAPYPGYGNFSSASGSVPRWIPNQRAIALSQFDSNGVAQAARYFIDTQTTEMLTGDAGDKAEVWMWSAPEFGGDLVFTTVVDGCCLRVYRQQGAGWTLVNSFTAAAIGNVALMFSPQPQVYKGHSYVAVQLGNQLKDLSSSIWVLAIDPAVPLLRQVSDPTTQGVRTEPEWLLTRQGAFVYYSQYALPSAPRAALRRAATGL
jgi:hypothetical protein